ncbi:CCR4-NOT transcription complex subunit 10, putative [Leishmania panamensis]|uniref:CCR4-NOT transcription complex subunit 10, putative n=1 Tax=Leishmania panamensis TaxID=5679 RepID=A0A088S528_LEIPA|nr:CCR4-NOT transcription complex subunit 10, putative [Leishmania panamensis]AIO02755.1 CCR4-NOT transcription complex subunit 10, putative [Leishmania panamensis]
MAEVFEKQLADAKTAFYADNYAEAERVLRGMPQEDLKVQHNLVITRYLQHQLSSEQTLAALRASAEGTGEDPNMKAPGLMLQYEGHETAVYNQAVLYARSGQAHEAVLLLRRILENAQEIALSTLVYSLCLFHTLTKPIRKTMSRMSSRHDEELVQTVLTSNMEKLRVVPELMKLVEAAFADSSGLHDVFSDVENDQVKQAVHLNNLGVFSLSEDKLNVASLCFTKAEKTAASKPAGQHILRSIQYNVGLCALLREDYEGALHEFLSLQDSMKASALFWVRCAEAAVSCVQQGARKQCRADYERQQNTFSEMLQSGKVYSNFEFMLLPSATTVPGPATIEPSRETTEKTALEQIATAAVQNALFLLVPKGHTFCSAVEAFPHEEALLQYAMLYWVALELSRRNYMAAAEAGQEMLNGHERHLLPPNLHATLLIYVVEALVHLNDPDRAMKVLRRTSLSSLVSGSNNDPVDAAQRSRVEALFVNLTISHILTGSWNQAHSIMESLLRKIYEVAPAGTAEYTPERDTMFTYCILEVFLELAQGNQEKAAEWMLKITWSI